MRRSVYVIAAALFIARASASSVFGERQVYPVGISTHAARLRGAADTTGLVVNAHVDGEYLLTFVSFLSTL